MKKEAWNIRYENNEGKIVNKKVICTVDGLYYHDLQIRKAGGKNIKFEKSIQV